MPLKRAFELIKKAREEEDKEIQYKFWLARYPLYTEKNYESFDEFYEKARPKKVEYDKRSKDEILKEINEIEKSFRKEG